MSKQSPYDVNSNKKSFSHAFTNAKSNSNSYFPTADAVTEALQPTNDPGRRNPDASLTLLCVCVCWGVLGEGAGGGCV